VSIEASPTALSDIRNCFEGIVPAVIATASADGTPNVTHLSRVHYVDEEHVALSNQFFSKTMRNLAENPTACVLVVDPVEWVGYRLLVRYERTERRGPLFERMHRDIEAVAALTGMKGVFKLRSADVYRVVELDRLPTVHPAADPTA
jgi:adenylate cyclase